MNKKNLMIFQNIVELIRKQVAWILKIRILLLPPMSYSITRDKEKYGNLEFINV
jgi:hypothetical protein